jgi:rhodanese-related sulfurtransferase
METPVLVRRVAPSRGSGNGLLHEAITVKEGICMMTDTFGKANILALLHFAREQEQQMVEDLSDEERNASGTPERWSAKDYLANILVWKELQTGKLAAAQRGETPPVWRDPQVVHQINSDGFLRFHERSFQEVQDEGTRVFQTFTAQVERLSEEELNDPNHFAWLDGEPLRGETMGNGLWHPCNQIAAFYLQSERRLAALQLQEGLLAAVRRANMPPENLGYVVYNRACFYAINGWPDKALQLLPEALRLRPTLVEWSRHDSDLDGLRAEPAFQAIFDDPQLQEQTPAVALVSPRELRTLAGGETPPFIIDVRGASEYAEGHVDGAVDIPLGQIERQLARIPRDRLVVTYCNMHHRGESRGERAAALLNKRGVQVRVLDGGYPAWQESALLVGGQPGESTR